MSIKSQLGFIPINEPLLKFVFDKGYYKEITEFDKKIIMPDPALLLAMKINSIKGRSEGHKKIKDICDLIAICLYSSIDLDDLKHKLNSIMKNKVIKKNIGAIGKEDVKSASDILEIDPGIILDLIRKLKIN